jgi:hypothetical protein
MSRKSKIIVGVGILFLVLFLILVVLIGFIYFHSNNFNINSSDTPSAPTDNHYFKAENVSAEHSGLRTYTGIYTNLKFDYPAAYGYPEINRPITPDGSDNKSLPVEKTELITFKTPNYNIYIGKAHFASSQATSDGYKITTYTLTSKDNKTFDVKIFIPEDNSDLGSRMQALYKEFNGNYFQTVHVSISTYSPQAVEDLKTIITSMVVGEER